MLNFNNGPLVSAVAHDELAPHRSQQRWDDQLDADSVSGSSTQPTLYFISGDCQGSSQTHQSFLNKLLHLSEVLNLNNGPFVSPVTHDDLTPHRVQQRGLHIELHPPPTH